MFKLEADQGCSSFQTAAQKAAILHNPNGIMTRLRAVARTRRGEYRNRNNPEIVVLPKALKIAVPEGFLDLPGSPP